MGWALVTSPEGGAGALIRAGEIRSITPDGLGPPRDIPDDILREGASRLGLREDGALAFLSQEGWTVLEPGSPTAQRRKGDALLLFPCWDGDDALLGFVPQRVMDGIVGMKEADYDLVRLDLTTGKTERLTDCTILDVAGSVLRGDSLVATESAYEDSDIKEYLVAYRRASGRWREESRVRTKGSVVQWRGDKLLGNADSGLAKGGPFAYEVSEIDPITGVTSPLTRLDTYIERFVALPDGATYVLHSPGRNRHLILTRLRDGRAENLPWPKKG